MVVLEEIHNDNETNTMAEGRSSTARQSRSKMILRADMLSKLRSDHCVPPQCLKALLAQPSQKQSQSYKLETCDFWDELSGLSARALTASMLQTTNFNFVCFSIDLGSLVSARELELFSRERRHQRTCGFGWNNFFINIKTFCDLTQYVTTDKAPGNDNLRLSSRTISLLFKFLCEHWTTYTKELRKLLQIEGGSPATEAVPQTAFRGTRYHVSSTKLTKFPGVCLSLDYNWLMDDEQACLYYELNLHALERDLYKQIGLQGSTALAQSRLLSDIIIDSMIDQLMRKSLLSIFDNYPPLSEYRLLSTLPFEPITLRQLSNFFDDSVLQTRLSFPSVVTKEDLIAKSATAKKVGSKGLPFPHVQPKRRVNSGRRMLPVSINGVLTHTIPDTGSFDNVISEEYALSIGAILDERSTPEPYFNACGREFISTWTTSLSCTFPDEAQTSCTSLFSVVSNLSVPVIMGSKFLDATQTLTKFKHRLVKLAHKALAKWRILQTQIPRRRLICTLNKQPVLANADTGSNIDLISLDYALQQNLHIQKIHKRFRKVELADGSIARLAGQVRCRFKVGNDGDLRDVEFRTFYVLPGLTSEVLLGDGLLAQHQVFDRHEHEFVIDDDTFPNSVDLIYWVGFEGWPSLSSMLEDAKTGKLEAVDTTPQNAMTRWAIRMGFKREPKIWRAADVLGHDANYERYVEKIANRNEWAKDRHQRRLATLSSQEASEAENAERSRLQQYEAGRRELEALHQARKYRPSGSA